MGRGAQGQWGVTVRHNIVQGHAYRQASLQRLRGQVNKADARTVRHVSPSSLHSSAAPTPPHPNPIRPHPQAVRNLDDMETMSIPQKYRQIMTFYKYYSGEKVAPIPTIFSESLLSLFLHLSVCSCTAVS